MKNFRKPIEKIEGNKVFHLLALIVSFTTMLISSFTGGVLTADFIDIKGFSNLPSLLIVFCIFIIAFMFTVYNLKIFMFKKPDKN